MNFINNKSAYIWSFNEVIGKDTTFDGNTNINSINEVKKIIVYLLEQKIYDENITENILYTFLKAFEIPDSILEDSILPSTEVGTDEQHTPVLPSTLVEVGTDEQHTSVSVPTKVDRKIITNMNKQLFNNCNLIKIRLFLIIYL
jgi:hypothetical protein